MTCYDDILDAIGNTPLVGLPSMSPKPGVRLWAKLEGNNPTGSTKDRIALAMVEAAEASGELTPDNTILEPTSGNTGISLAMVAAEGLPLTVVLPDNASQERLGLLRLFGAEIVFSDGDKGTNGSIEVARATRRGPHVLHALPVREPRQPASARGRNRARIVTDLPEVTHFVAGMGTGGTLTGVGRALHAHDPSIQIVAAEPELGDLVYGLRSLDEGFVPPIFDPSEVNRKFLVNSDDALRATRELTRGRASSRASLRAPSFHVAQRIAAELDEGHVVCLLADGGWKYLSTEAWADDLDDRGEEGLRVLVVVSDPRPIGVFDSGVGGLTVARAIIDLLPHEPLIYVGDSARFPYGSQPVERIRQYALEIAEYLVQRNVKLLVIACNSIEVSAIGDIAVSADIPVVGVVNPGSRAAIRATRNGVVGVIGTEATIATGAYQRAIGSAASLHTAACPDFVDHVERGDTSSPELRSVARGYLEPLMEAGIDTLVLGCTHYPLLSGLLQLELGPDVVLVSSAEETAKDVYGELVSRELLAPADGKPVHEFVTTGDPERFQRLAEVFLGPEVRDLGVEQVTVEGAWS